jgi:hypothetical protein
MGRLAFCTCLLAVSLFGLSQPLLADGVHSFNHSVAYYDLPFSDINHDLIINHDFDFNDINHDSDVIHEHGTGKAWGHWKHHGNDNDGDDNEWNGGDQGTSGSGSGTVNIGGSDGSSGGDMVSVPEPSALLLLMIGLAALFLGNSRNSLRKLSA